MIAYLQHTLGQGSLESTRQQRLPAKLNSNLSKFVSAFTQGDLKIRRLNLYKYLILEILRSETFASR